MKKLKTDTTNTASLAVQPEAAFAVSTPAPAALKKVNLAGFAVQSPGSKSPKAYPLLPDCNGQVSELVTSILDKSAQLEALEGALELAKAELIALAKPFYFEHHTGQLAVAASVEARSLNGTPVRVGFANAYRGTSDEPALVRIAGEQATRFFKQSFELKIKGDLIPEAAADALLAGLQALFATHGATSALTAKAVFKPTKEFHIARHTAFSIEENLELDKVVPLSASVRTKLGRGGEGDE